MSPSTAGNRQSRSVGWSLAGGLLCAGLRATTPIVNMHALLAAIPGLNPKLEERDAEIQALKRQKAAHEKRLNALELLISSITEKN
jgi:hypothetical protein